MISRLFIYIFCVCQDVLLNDCYTIVCILLYHCDLFLSLSCPAYIMYVLSPFQSIWPPMKSVVK